VVEGVSDHACEYRTGGKVAILGVVGRNVAAGMTGGTLFVWDPGHAAKRSFADSAPRAERPGDADAGILRDLIDEHVTRTGSALGRTLLADWEQARGEFWMLRAHAPPAVAEPIPFVDDSADPVVALSPGDGQMGDSQMGDGQLGTAVGRVTIAGD
jgi:glutamate synthase domain-containing protein 3